MSIKHGSWKWLLCQNFKLMSASTIASVTFESNPSKPSLYININRIHKSRVLCTQKKKSVAKNEITTKPNLQHTNSRNRGQSKSAFPVSIIFLKDLSLSLASTRLYYYSPNPLSHSFTLTLSWELHVTRDPHSHSDPVSLQAGTSLTLSLIVFQTMKLMGVIWC